MKNFRFSFKKLGLQVLIALLVFLAVGWSFFSEDLADDAKGTASTFYLLTSIFFITGAWRVSDSLVYRQLKQESALNFKNGMQILIISLIITLPIIALVYYLAIFVFSDTIYFVMQYKPEIMFRMDFFRASIFCLTLIIFNLFYHSMMQKRDIEQKMNQLSKELMTSKYKSLKSQISPHFLFNSLNTLTSLMYEDRDLASDFVTRLATCYRYILDNREEDLVSLEKELNFLDSFIFMMNVRHENALSIDIDVPKNAGESMVPTLSLQMLMENALKHNYYSKEKPLKIKITTVGKLAIVVKNTLRKRELEEESTHLGISNIKKRYSFYSNQEVTVEVKNDYFMVTMPLLNKNVTVVPKLAIK